MAGNPKNISHDDDLPISRLLSIMTQLRDPTFGCPWDIEQTFETIAPYTIEEAYEVADTIERKAWEELEGELGDLLLQVVYFAQMGREAGLFDFDSVTQRIADKMIVRHPHVFDARDPCRTAKEQSVDWEAQKARERGDVSTLSGVALGLPALTRALKLQKRAARVGFDWDNVDSVIAKISEEAQELAAARQRPKDRAEELGDLLFAVVNLARHLDIDPETALRRTNAKFERRFGYVEEVLKQRGRKPETADLSEMDALWNEAKAKESETNRPQDVWTQGTSS